MRQIPEPMAQKLAAAAGDFASSWDDVRTDDIAAASGIPRATLYYYFSSKEEILGFLLERVLDDLETAVTDLDHEDQPVPERLRAVVRAQLAHLGDNPALAQLLTSNLGKASKLPDLAAAIDRAFHRPVRRLLSLGAANGELRPVDPDLAATALYGAVTVVGLRQLVVDGHLDADEVTQQLVPMFWTGLQPGQLS
jgi:AcrR family transcriptional regulator